VTRSYAEGTDVPTDRSSAEWLQHPGTHREHYDVTDKVRDRALQLGAEPIIYRQTGEITQRKREATT
jgi:hypothetical protein